MGGEERCAREERQGSVEEGEVVEGEEQGAVPLEETADGESGVSSARTETEQVFVNKLFAHPDAARKYALQGLDACDDVCQILMAWAQNERNYGNALDKVIIYTNPLNAVKSASKGMANALAAVVGSFQSAGKHHLGLHLAIESEVQSILKPMLRQKRGRVDEVLATQMTVQKEVAKMRDQLKKLKDEVASSSSGSAKTPKLEELSSRYEEKTFMQSQTLKQFLRHMYRVAFGRAGQLSLSFLRIKTSNEHVLNFSDEIARALQDIVESVDAERDLAIDLTSLVDIDQEKLTPDASGSLAGKIYEALGNVEPDVASASVDAVGELCNNSITVGTVSLRIAENLAIAVETRAKGAAQLASGSSLNLSYLKSILVDEDELLTEEQVLDTERSAWRVFMVSMKQASMVLEDWSKELRRTSESFSTLVARSESAHKQILAARSAANKELQSCAKALKEARANLDALDDSILKYSEQRDRASSDFSELQSKVETRRKRQSGGDSAPSPSTSSSARGADALQQQEAGSGEDASSSGNVVARLFGLPGVSDEQALADAKERAMKAETALSESKSTRNELLQVCQATSEKLESQINAYAVQMAGTVSSFVSSHALVMNRLKQGLDDIVRGAASKVSVMRQLEDKMMRALCSIDPVKDIEKFMEEASVTDSDSVVVQAPVSFKSPSSQLMEGPGVEEEVEEDQEAVLVESARSVSKRQKADELARGFRLPPGQEIIGSFSCAFLPGKVPQQGYMTLTNRFLCFRTLPIYEPMFGCYKLVVEFADINQIKKARSAWGLVANSLAIELKPHNGSIVTLNFTSLFYRDKCYEQLQKLLSINRELLDSKVHLQEDGAEKEKLWKEFDPRLVEVHGLTMDSSRKPKSTSLSRIGHSTTDLEELSREVEMTHEEESSEGAEVHDDRSSDAAARACPSCQKLEDPTAPCECWAPGVSPHVNKTYTAISESYWRGTAHDVFASLFLGCDATSTPVKVTVDDDHVVVNTRRDISKEMSEKLGDFDADFPSFRVALPNRSNIAWASREGYPEYRILEEEREAAGGALLYRVVSFSHPIPNTLLGKQVARTTQIHTCSSFKFDASTKELTIPADIPVVLDADTSLAGFPYSDTFMVRTRYVLVPMKSFAPQPGVSWCKIEAFVKIVWLKSVSVPFLKSKIEKENITTGESNMEKWVQLSRTKFGGAGVTAPRPVVGPKRELESKAALEEPDAFDLGELLGLEFYLAAWGESSRPQKLQTILLGSAVLLLLWIVLFK